MKDGHHQAPGALVIVAVGRYQPVAQQGNELAVHALAPAELLSIGDEQEVLCLRAEHHDAEPVKEPHGEDRPVALVGSEQQ